MRKPSNVIDRSPIRLLHRASQGVTELFVVEIGDNDLTQRQLTVLITVAHNENRNQAELVNLTGIDRSTLADIVKRMQRKGLLRRRRTNQDARAYAVKLTAEGRQLVQTAEPLGKRIDACVLEALPARRRDEFVEALQLIVDKLTR